MGRLPLVRAAAYATNLALLVAGVLLQARPRYPSDRWTAGSLVAVAILNGVALLPRQRDPEAEHRRGPPAHDDRGGAV